MVVFIGEQGARVRREGQHLVVESRENPQTLLPHRLEQLILLGNVQLTPPARSLLLRENIDTVFLRSDGSYLGRMGQGGDGANTDLRKRQFLLSEDREHCARMARSIVHGKLHNQACQLMRLHREHGIEEATHGASEIQAIMAELPRAETVESMRGLEGAAAAAYFAHYPRAFHRDWGFHKRVRRPPTDPVNVILSLLYTILVSRCFAACRIAGLDPFVGNLHALSYGRHSLPLDLVEEFRPILADTLALAIFNRKMLSQADFERRQDPDEETQKLVLAKPGYRTVLNALAKKMETRFHHAGEQMTYSQAILRQAWHYREVVLGEKPEYQPILAH